MEIRDPKVTPYRGLTVVIWRTDDPYEIPEDDPRDDHEQWEPVTPWDVGDFYFGIAEWELQIPTNLASHDGALKAAADTIDKVLDNGADPRQALVRSGLDPIDFHFFGAPPAP